MKVTILTPTLNAERYLGECLRSLREQTHPRTLIQHLVMDGGSTDATTATATAAGAEVHVEPDGTLYAALNSGMRLATGDVIGWLNADDVYEPEILATVARKFHDHPAAEIVVADYAVGTPGSAVPRRTSAAALRRIRDGMPGRECWVTPLAAFYRTETLRALGDYSTRYRVAGDLDMWIRAAARMPIPEVVHAGKIAGTFRTHPDSLSWGRDRTVPLREVIEVASRWITDGSTQAGVRRFALYLLRRHRYELSEWESRGLSWPRRVTSRIQCLRALATLGPGALGDVRTAIW